MHNAVMTDIAHIRARLARHTPCTERGDHDLNPGLRPDADLRPAAVLICLVTHDDGLSVLLTRRTDHLEHHPGQISFPGGHVEDGDEDAVATALRETHEEIGLPPEQVEVVGRLDDYVTRTGFHIIPVVGLVRPPFELVADPHEVEEVFEVPLDFLLNPANHQRHIRQYAGAERSFYAMPYGDYFIWGATAGMLMNLFEALTEHA